MIRELQRHPSGGGVTSVNGQTGVVVLTPADIGLGPTGVTPGTYGDSTHYTILTVDQYGRATGVTEQAFPTPDLDALLPRDGSRPMTGFFNYAEIDSSTIVTPPPDHSFFWDTFTGTLRYWNSGSSNYYSVFTTSGGVMADGSNITFPSGIFPDQLRLGGAGISFSGTNYPGIQLKQLSDSEFSAVQGGNILGDFAVSTTGNRPIFYDGTSAKYVLLQGDAGTGSVTSVSVTTANGVSGTVATATTTPAISLTLGAITPSSVNGNTITSGTGTLTLASYTLTVAGTASVSGTNTGDQTNIAGNAATATALQTARNINGVSFNGTADITVTAAAGTLTGTTLNSTVVTSSLTSFGKATTAPMIQLGTIASIYG